MKYAAERLFAAPETAARKLIEIANAVETVRHKSGTYVKFTSAGPELELFA